MLKDRLGRLVEFGDLIILGEISGYLSGPYIALGGNERLMNYIAFLSRYHAAYSWGNVSSRIIKISSEDLTDEQFNSYRAMMTTIDTPKNRRKYERKFNRVTNTQQPAESPDEILLSSPNDTTHFVPMANLGERVNTLTSGYSESNA